MEPREVTFQQDLFSMRKVFQTYVCFFQMNAHVASMLRGLILIYRIDPNRCSVKKTVTKSFVKLIKKCL